jgi:hypothetical protein
LGASVVTVRTPGRVGRLLGLPASARGRAAGRSPLALPGDSSPTPSAVGGSPLDSVGAPLGGAGLPLDRAGSPLDSVGAPLGGAGLPLGGVSSLLRNAVAPGGAPFRPDGGEDKRTDYHHAENEPVRHRCSLRNEPWALQGSPFRSVPTGRCDVNQICRGVGHPVVPKPRSSVCARQCRVHTAGPSTTGVRASVGPDRAAHSERSQIAP